VLDPILRVILIVAGGVLFLLAFTWLVRDWRTVKVSRRTVAAYYTAVVLVLVGLQPIRLFKVEVLGPVLLSPVAELRQRNLDDLKRDRWIRVIARPAVLEESDHAYFAAVRPTVERAFSRFAAGQPQIRGPDAPDFVVAGRTRSGLSVNPETRNITFVFLIVVVVVAAFRHLVRWM
jgi:hypothetical protein